MVLERWTFCQYIGFWRLATKTDHQRGERGGWVDKWAIDGWYSLDVLNSFTFSTLAMLKVTTYAAHQNNVKVVRWRSGRLIWTDVLINWIVSLFSRLREINKIMSREPMSWIVSLFFNFDGWLWAFFAMRHLFQLWISLSLWDYCWVAGIRKYFLSYIWTSGYQDIWLSGYLDIWISGYLDIGYLDIFEYLRISLNICGWRFGVGWDQKVWMAPIKIIPSSPAHFFNTFNATTSVFIMIIIIVIIITTIIITIIVVIITRVGLSGLWSISHSDHRQPIFHFLATTAQCSNVTFFPSSSSSLSWS